MIEQGIIMEDINMAILEWANKAGDIDKIKYIYSDDNSNELIGRISINTMISDQGDMLNGLKDQSDIISIIKKLSEELLNDIVIKGVKNITNIVMSNNNTITITNDEIMNEKMWILETDGTNLLDILLEPFVDIRNTVSNDINEVYKLLGIEAARGLLITEIKDVINEGAGYINYRHIELLCDTMTSKGFITSINRQGINRGDVGPLAKCSFEDTTDQLIKASIFGERDKLQGVSSNIMLGQTIPSGTGFCDIFLDEDKMIHNLTELNTIDDDIEFEEGDLDNLMNIEDDECNNVDLSFSFE